MADLTDKEQPLLWAIPLAGMAAMRAGLTGVVGIDLHTERTSQMRLVDEQAMQFGKGPLGGMPIGPALLLACLFALLPLGPLADMGQVFQADETVGVGIQNALTDSVVGIQLQPSLSPADGDAPSCCRASAFSLESLLQAGIMVCFAWNQVAPPFSGCGYPNQEDQHPFECAC